MVLCELEHLQGKRIRTAHDTNSDSLLKPQYTLRGERSTSATRVRTDRPKCIKRGIRLGASVCTGAIRYIVDIDVTCGSALMRSKLFYLDVERS